MPRGPGGPWSTRRGAARLLVAVAISVALIACGGDDNPDAGAPVTGTGPTDTTTTEPSATTEPTTTTDVSTTTTESVISDLEIIGLGEFDVGITTVTVGEATDRPLTVDVWFPIDEAGGSAPYEYTFLPGIFYRSPNAVSATFAQGSTAGPFPLVLYSHGSGGQRFIHSNFTETLASHGHVVVAADHTGNTLIESLVGSEGDLSTSLAVRPRDVNAVLDAVLGADGPTALNDALGPLISDDPVIITGHSVGGFTSYAAVAGIELGSEVIEPDVRIGAIIALAPLATVETLPDSTLAQIDVPQLIIVGTDDKTVPVDPNVERPWALSPGSPAYRVELVAGEHLTFTDMCDYVTFLPELGTVPEFIVTELDDRSQQGCSTGDMPIARAQELTNTFAIRFLDAFYGDDPFIDPSSEALPEDVIFQSR